MKTSTRRIRDTIALALAVLALAGCHGHLKHIDGPGHSEDAPGQQKK